MMPASTNEIAPSSAENQKCTTDAPTKKQKVNDCKLVSITLPNAGPLGLSLLKQNEGKSLIIDEVIPQSQAEKYGVLAGDIPVYNNSISSFVGGIGYISYETFLQRAKNVRPFVFSVLRSGSYNKSSGSTTNQSTITEAAAPSRELKLLDGACEATQNGMHEGANSIGVDQNNKNKSWDAFESFMKNYESSEDDEPDEDKKDLVYKSIKSSHPKRFEAEGTDEDIHNKTKNHTHEVSEVCTPSVSNTATATNNNAITPASSSIKLPIKRSLRKHIIPPKRFVARPSKFGWKNDDGDKAFLENDVEYFSENRVTEAKTPSETTKQSIIKPSTAANNTCSGSNLSGVHCFGSSNEYKSIIFYEGSGYSLGKYQLASDAALAYDKAALSIGPYWDINFSSWDEYIATRTLELKRRGSSTVNFTLVLEEISLRASEVASKVVNEAELNDSEWAQRFGSVAIHEERIKIYRSARTLLPKKDDRDPDESILIYPEEGSMSSSLADTSTLCKDSWSAVELKQFEEGCIIEGIGNWAKVASHVPTKTKRQVYYHACLLLFGFHQKDLDRLRREHDAYHSLNGDKQHKNAATEYSFQPPTCKVEPSTPTTITTKANNIQVYTINTKVSKEFQDDDGEMKLFSGTVKSYDCESKLYKVEYEDGDSEELSEKEVGKYLDEGMDGVQDVIQQGIGEENGDEYPFLEEEEYQVHEKIFAWDQEVLYEAKVLQCKENDNKAHGHKYFVHYLGYKQSHNKWLTSGYMMKLTPTNRKFYCDSRGLEFVAYCRFSNHENGEEEEYGVQEKVFAWDQGVLYEAKVLRCKKDSKAQRVMYLIHYLGYPKSHNKWLTSKDLMKLNTLNKRLYCESRGLPIDEDESNVSRGIKQMAESLVALNYDNEEDIMSDQISILTAMSEDSDEEDKSNVSSSDWTDVEILQWGEWMPQKNHSAEDIQHNMNQKSLTTQDNDKSEDKEDKSLDQTSTGSTRSKPMVLGLPNVKRGRGRPKISKKGSNSHWTDTEHQQFKQGCILFGWGNWKDVERVVKTRTNTQILKHAQNYAEEKACLDRLHELHIQGICVGLPAELMSGVEDEPTRKDSSSSSSSGSGSKLLASSDKESVIEDEEEEEQVVGGECKPLNQTSTTIQSNPVLCTEEVLPNIKQGTAIEKKGEAAKRGRGRPKKSKRGSTISLPKGVSETTAGIYRVRVFYQGKERGIGSFKTLEQATLANEIARNMLNKDKGLQLSPEECERNFKLAKEAALADVPNNEMCSKRGPKKVNSTTSVLAQPGNYHKVNDCRDLDGGVSTNGRKRKLSRKLADSLQLVAEKKQPGMSIQQSDLFAKKRQKETPKPTDEPGNESKTSIALKLPRGVCETPTGSWRVQVWYQSSLQYIGTFQTLEQATMANEIAWSVLKKDKESQLTAEECEQNVKLAKEAVSASCAKRDRGRPTKAKTNEKKDTAKRGRGRPKKVNSTPPAHHSDVNGGVSAHGRSRKLSKKKADALDFAAEKKQPAKKTRDDQKHTALKQHTESQPQKEVPVNIGYCSTAAVTEACNAIGQSSKGSNQHPKKRPAETQKSSKTTKKVKPNTNESLNGADKKRVNAAIEAVTTTYGVGVDMQTKLAAAVLRGVTCRPSGKWQAQVYYAGKSQYIGVFDTKVKASFAYEIARQLLNSEPVVSPSGEEIEANIRVARKAGLMGIKLMKA